MIGRNTRAISKPDAHPEDRDAIARIAGRRLSTVQRSHSTSLPQKAGCGVSEVEVAARRDRTLVMDCLPESISDLDDETAAAHSSQAWQWNPKEMSRASSHAILNSRGTLRIMNSIGLSSCAPGILDSRRLYREPCRSRGIAIEWLRCDAIPLQALDRNLMEQALLNVVKNAMEAVDATSAEKGSSGGYVHL